MENLIQLTPPSVEPITVDQAKKQCRCQLDSENDLFSIWVSQAREYAEAETNKQLITATWQLQLECFPFTGVSRIWPQRSILGSVTVGNQTPASLQSLEIPLGIAPVVPGTVVINYYDAAGVNQTLDSSKWQLRANEDYAWVLPMPSSSWPETQSGRLDAVRITFNAGYSTKPEDLIRLCPSIVQAMLLIVDCNYQERGPALKIPDAVDNLLARKKSLRYR